MKKLILYAAALLAFASCDKESAVVQPQTTAVSSSVLQDKQWFEEHYLSDKNSVAATASRGGQKTVKWENATVETYATGKKTYVPLTYSQKGPTPQQRYRLVITTDKNGNKKAEVLQYVADVSYYTKKREISTTDFSGLIISRDWNEQFLYGYQYKDAKIIRSVSPTSATTATRPTGQDCTIMTVIYYSQACSGGVCYDAVEVYRETYVACTTTGGGGTGDGGGGEGGGPSGGGGGPLGGGGDGSSGCGSAVVCPDGTTNPNITPIRVEIVTEADYLPATLTVDNPTLGNYGATLRIMDGLLQVVECSVELDTNAHDLKKISVSLGGVVWVTQLTQNGDGIFTRYDAATDTYYFRVSITKTYADMFSNTRTLYGQISPSHGTGKIYFP